MTKDRKRLIHDFIEGNYIENISELKNDYMFMIDVINYTNDRSIYYLCSDEVKCNLEFVKFLINKFKNRKQFICHVVDRYLESVDENDITRFELLITFCDILNSIEVDYNALTYSIKKLSFYKSAIDEINNLINEGKIDNLESGLGFSYIISKYGNSKVITDYIAYNYVSEIFYNNKNLRLEDVLHKMFATSDELIKYGVVDFILDYVKRYDEVLSNYLLLNRENIKKVELSINYIINNWDDYVCTNDCTLLKKENKTEFLCGVIDLNTDRIVGTICPKKVRQKENTN